MEEGFKVVNLSGVVPTPNIRTNGNWFVGNEDTGVAAKGETGEQGPQGEKGDQGEIGPTGPQGPQGEKGTDADTSKLERLSNEVDTINQRLNDNIKTGYGTSVNIGSYTTSANPYIIPSDGVVSVACMWGISNYAQIIFVDSNNNIISLADGGSFTVAALGNGASNSRVWFQVFKGMRCYCITNTTGYFSFIPYV